MAEANLNLIFDCFNGTTDEEIAIASDVLLKLAGILSDGTIVEKYSACLQRGIDHPNPQVKATHVKVILKTVKDPNGIEQVLNNEQ